MMARDIEAFDVVQQFPCLTLVLLSLLVLIACESQYAPPEDLGELIDDLETVRNIDTCDGSYLHRVQVVEALSALHDEHAIAPLIAALHSTDETVLSGGATGCTPGKGDTYGAIADALAQFGEKSKAAVPRLVELLKQHPRYTSRYLSALVSIESDDALPLVLETYEHVFETTEKHVPYLDFLQTFEQRLKPHSEQLRALAQKFDLSDRSAYRTILLRLLLYMDAAERPDDLLQALMRDAKAMGEAGRKAFHHIDPEIVDQLVHVVENFDTVFTKDSLEQLTMMCGRGSELDRKKRALKSTLITYLYATCSAEGEAAAKRLESARDRCFSGRPCG